ncbi:HVA22-like protein [Abeliophyllum distichum]|uniref:HVA22-like protein n=1 Tax=Abeliophyllum distichum TaxID=126358 RepID=A0ABD1SZQ9_9LAMI
MGSINLLIIIFAKFFNVLAWPSIPLVYPLYASVRAIACDEESFYQSCLKYWVLFSIATILECTLAKLLVWFSLWPYIKGIATILLIAPSFAGASYVYTHFVRIAEDSCFWDMLLIPESKSCLIVGQTEFCDQAGCHTREDGGEESENLVTYELSGTTEKLRNKPGTGETRATGHMMIGVLSQPGCLKKVRREWSCPLCLISSTSEKDLRMHFQGKKHKVKQMEHNKQKNAAATKETNIF